MKEACCDFVGKATRIRCKRLAVVVLQSKTLGSVHFCAQHIPQDDWKGWPQVDSLQADDLRELAKGLIARHQAKKEEAKIRATDKLYMYAYAIKYDPLEEENQ